ncbi:MAG: bifunctional 4-hydroxy-3-methylbut-2-enyl diphosphate reductase/30S ribosomal protein S1 [Candidatus Improbicoccus pseudotrichonymphae]|uniref:Bifunctional 4-hydroxy-3-methylbut-2-enyl diphosphate reductase/30S ribosomal protein S1 n=1 Tax=Candidatus Improbicoccus pseudotrichonymphae TaxID=3033792 RepID=A0AA48IAY6_9FIRM|nr:MAG: bifunctional 4-hydroxy-3-methylbut-2-enyl diphosphate reductase/30S ribosomal protein S1 [Candidatus Improbicoccus pseudotrichonymphae]
MILKLSKYAGFCFGVDLAVKAALEHKNLYLLGEIAHNEILMRKLRSKNIKIVENIHDIDKNVKNANILIRTHGVGKNITDEIKSRNFNIVDKTCPNVRIIHSIVRNISSETKLIIIGEATHAEVVGIKNQVENKKNVTIISSLDDLKNQIQNINFNNNFTVVAQTTFDDLEFEKITDILKEKIVNICIHKTICRDSLNRRNELLNEISDSDFVIVVGSQKSSNSRALYNISRKIKDTIFIENHEGLNFEIIKNKNKIFITSGASVMPATILEIVNYINLNCQITKNQINTN